MVFDLDGVICDIDIATLRIIDTLRLNTDNKNVIEELNKAERWYYIGRKLELNPYMFLHEDDQAVIVTSRPTTYKDVTLKWLNMQGIYLPIYFTRKKHIDWTEGIEKGLRLLAEYKAKRLKQLGVGLYIDDNPEIVEHLRDLGVNCIQYGGRQKYES